MLDARISKSETETDATTEYFDTKHSDIISSICAIDDNRFISASVDGCINITNWCHETYISTEGHDSTVTCIKYNPSQNYFLTSSRDKSIKFWNLNDISDTDNINNSILNHTAIFEGHQKGVTSIDICQNCSSISQKLWSGARDARVIVWDVETQKQIVNKFIDRNLTRALKIVPDSVDCTNDNHLIQCCEDLKLRVWDARMGSVHTTVDSGPNIPLSLDIDSNGLTCSVTFNGFQGEFFIHWVKN